MNKGFVLEGTKVICHDDNIEKSLRRFKKKVQDGGILMDLKKKEGYIKPTTARRLARNQAKQRWARKVKADELPPKLY